MKKVMVLALVVVLGGCTRTGIIEHNINLGKHSFTPSISEEYDFDVKVNRSVDIGWDTSRIEDRMRVIRQLLGDSCKNPVIVEERYVDRGESSIGIKQGTYFIKISCK